MCRMHELCWQLQEGGAKMALSSRRSFLMLAVGDAGIYSDSSRFTAQKSEVEYPCKISRTRIPLPASVKDDKTFARKCVGCLLCVHACPRNVLQVDEDRSVAIRPGMDFRYGWCFPECSRCAEVCPAGALGKPIEFQEKLKRRIGLAILSPDRCLATNGVKCNSCLRHCPVNAIKHDDKGFPLVDGAKCIGCGSCEYHCPARPTVAIHVEGKK